LGGVVPARLAGRLRLHQEDQAVVKAKPMRPASLGSDTGQVRVSRSGCL